MIAISLQSGSSGNCIFVESCGVRLLFDAGISGVTAERRLAVCGCDIRDVDAAIISHDHSDHAKFAGVYNRKYGLPLYLTEKTLDAADERCGLGPLRTVKLFESGKTLTFGSVSVHTIPTPHDGQDGVIFVVESRRKRLGIMTDLGHVFDRLAAEVASLDAVFMESNYDAAMLADGPYPAFLKRRIRGPRGHISNIESAELLSHGARLKWACLSHLSEQNNDPEVALRTHYEVLGERLKLFAASRYLPTGAFHI
ncbi:Beta-lactamase domain-containing protein [Candidatus Sulfobium mesophilum]|uniref:Beta-lactamase domain-containing protein n=1 Tax=Candidatus Sulfobium mesophilum TaxID=2016548 RepID=A0A2U3QK69_9BACT|nr:Beta-lactamase domain-containing protein [Candidatus Sulfobium mesophilum]